MIVKNIVRLLSPGGRRARLSILIFHRVLSRPDPLFPNEPDVAKFDEMMAWVAKWFEVLPLNTAITQLRAGTLPTRAAAITFDDGYADNASNALPVLKHHGMSGTFFIATGFLDGGRMWNDTIIESVRGSTASALDFSELGLGRHPIASLADKQAAISALIGQIKYRSVEDRVVITEQLAQLAGVKLSQDLMMSSQAVRDMHRAGMQIGAHTVSHPILSRLTTEQAREEIGQSKQFLEQLLGERVGLFAYPNGKPGVDYNADSVTLVRELGFDAAVSTHWGAVKPATDVFQMPRFTPWDRTRLKFAGRMVTNLLHT